MSKILNAISRKLGDYQSDNRGWFHFWCPWDEHKSPKLGINLETMRFSCISCHKFGYITDLLEKLGIRLEWESGERKKYKPPTLKEPPAKIQGFKRFVDTHDGGIIDLFIKDVIKYTQKRAGLGLSDLAERGWGYIPYGHLSMRLIIPINLDGRMVSFLARSVYDFITPKELAGPIKDGWWPRSEIAYGLDEIHEGDDVVLVEGPWDKVNMDPVLTGYTTVALLGSHLSASVCGRILAKRPRKIVLFLDGDEAGRNGAESITTTLRRRKYKQVYVVETPEAKDPDELKSEAEKLVRNARYWFR